MTNTVITCPKCAKACFAVEIVASDVTQDLRYMHLTCQHCSQQLQFVVDLQPQFEASASVL